MTGKPILVLGDIHIGMFAQDAAQLQEYFFIDEAARVSEEMWTELTAKLHRCEIPTIEQHVAQLEGEPRNRKERRALRSRR